MSDDRYAKATRSCEDEEDECVDDDGDDIDDNDESNKTH